MFVLLLLLLSLCSVSEEETTEESDIMESTDSQLEIVTECWIEPQAGVVSHHESDERQFFRGLDYTNLAESVSSTSISSFFDGKG